MDNTYNVYRKLKSEDDSQYTMIASGLTSTNYTDRTCDIGKEYDYKIESNTTEAVNAKWSNTTTTFTSVDNKLDTVINQIKPVLPTNAAWSTTLPRDQITNAQSTAPRGSVWVLRSNGEYGSYLCKPNTATRRWYYLPQALNTNDFTLEFIYTMVNSKNGRMISLMNDASGGGAFLLDSIVDTTTNTIGISCIINTGSWNHFLTTASLEKSRSSSIHVCIQRRNTLFYAYVDGKLLGVSAPISYNMYSSRLFINGWVNNDSDAGGLYSDLRITKDICRYPLLGFKMSDVNMRSTNDDDPYWNNVIINLLHNKNGSTSDVKYNTGVAGTYSPQLIVPYNKDDVIYMDGSSTYRTSIPTLGLMDFTLEFTVFYNSHWQRYPRMFEIGGPSAHVGQIVGVVTNTNVLEAHCYYSGAYHSFRLCQLITNKDTTIRIMRKNGIFYCYVDDVKESTITDLQTFSIVGTTLTVMSGQVTESYLYGNIVDIRLSNIARYDETLSIIEPDKLQTLVRKYNYSVEPIGIPITRTPMTTVFRLDGSSFIDANDGVEWTAQDGITIGNTNAYEGYNRDKSISNKQYIKLNSNVLSRTGVQPITGDFRMYLRFKYDRTSVSTVYEGFIYSPDGSFIIRFGDTGFGDKLQYMFDGTTINSVYSTSLTKGFFISDQWYVLEFVRVNGACRIIINGTVYSVNTGANPSTYPNSNVTLNNTAFATGAINLAGPIIIDEFILERS